MLGRTAEGTVAGMPSAVTDWQQQHSKGIQGTMQREKVQSASQQIAYHHNKTPQDQATGLWGESARALLTR